MAAHSTIAQNEQYYRIILDNLSQGIIVCQLLYNEQEEPVDYLILDINHAVEEHSGLKKEQIVGKRATEIRSVVEPEWLLKCGEVVKTGKTAELEIYNASSFDGWIDVQVISLQHQDRFLILFTNITEHVKLKETLRESEKLARSRARELKKENRQKVEILESISDCFYALDKDLRYIYVNKSTEEICGISRNDLIGRMMEEVFPVVNDVSLSKFRQVLMEQTPQQYEVFSKIVNRWGDIYVYPTQEGISVFFHDITEKKALEMEKERYMKMVEERVAWQQDILDLMLVGVWISDHTGKVVTINQAALDMYGGRSPLAGTLDEYTSYKLFHSDTGEPVLFEPYPMREALRGVVLDYEGFDGKRGTLVASTDALYDEEGNYINYVAVAMDITELREAEKALRESEKEALDLVEKLKKANEHKNKFIAMLSHELRNPLAAVIMGLSLLEHVEPGSEQALRATQTITRQAQQLSRLVDDLLDVTRIRENNFNLQKSNLEINQLLEHIVQDNQPGFEAKDIDFVASFTPEKLMVEGDMARLMQAVGNLLDNALKFTARYGKVVLSLSKDEKENMAVISVIDNGQGISSDLLEHLFEPFVQAEQGLDRSYGGLGLGLPIVKGIIDNHGGIIKVLSEGLGMGTTFTIGLPLLEEIN